MVERNKKKCGNRSSDRPKKNRSTLSIEYEIRKKPGENQIHRQQFLTFQLKVPCDQKHRSQRSVKQKFRFDNGSVSNGK